MLLRALLASEGHTSQVLETLVEEWRKAASANVGTLLPPFAMRLPLHNLVRKRCAACADLPYRQLFVFKTFNEGMPSNGDLFQSRIW
jgi:hypothetical protein